jgi:hypothetical protein
MKTTQKKGSFKLPEVTFIERKEPIKFAEDYEPFAEKIAEAREMLRNVKLPPR